MFFGSLGFSPNTLTLAGLITSILIPITFLVGRPLASAFLILLCGFFDFADGALADYSRKKTRFGGFLDSVTDRISDFLLLLGPALYLGDMYSWIITLFALHSTFMVSYIRARGEAEGIADFKVGLMERPERIITLFIFTLINMLKMGLIILTLLSYFTVIQRFLYGKKKLKALNGKAERKCKANFYHS